MTCFANVGRSDYVICCGYPDPKSLLRGPPWEHNHTCVSARSKHDTMLEIQSHAQPRRSAPPREFFLPVDVYISNQAAAALRKVRLTYFTTTYFPICSQNSPTHGKKLRKESLPLEVCLCWVMITKGRLKVRGQVHSQCSALRFIICHREDELVQPGLSPDDQ